MTRALPNPRAPRTPAITRRVIFCDQPPTGADVLFRTIDPRPAVAWLTPDVAAVGVGFTLSLSAEPLANVTVTADDVRVLWTAGRVDISATAETDRRAATEVIAEFHYYESHLRALEAELPALESDAATDVAFAFRPKNKHGAEWDRLGKRLEKLATLRLTFARLEPRLTSLGHAHPALARKLFRRLVQRLDIEIRLEAVTYRLEACEDLYEGAVDRITDHRWYVRGFRLEMGIVVLLVIEVVQISCEIWMRWRNGR